MDSLRLTEWILAAGDAANDAGAKDGGGWGWINMILPFAIIGLLFYWLLIKPQRQEQAKRQAMLATVKKNDRVLTVGGIYGVVTNVHREADEVTVKVDEATNTKLRMTVSSIARILSEEAAEESSAKQSS